MQNSQKATRGQQLVTNVPHTDVLHCGCEKSRYFIYVQTELFSDVFPCALDERRGYFKMREADLTTALSGAAGKISTMDRDTAQIRTLDSGSLVAAEQDEAANDPFILTTDVRMS